MARAIDVANYFLNYADKDENSGELISNLKMQKLAYYTQGFSLAVLNSPLFSERIEAWPHGPVVPDLYHELKQYGSGPITPPIDFNASDYFSKDEVDLLDEVFNVYGQFSAWKLRNLTHEENPWKNNYKNNGEISHDELKDFFITLVND